MNTQYSQEQPPVRVLIVDDHLIVREGLRLILEKAGKGKGFLVVGDASDGASALILIGETQPDVVLMDIRMPGMDGLEVIGHVRQTWPRIAIVILTTYNEDTLILQGLRAGACGYLLKDASRETLFYAIHTAARGELLLQPEMMARILAHTEPSTLPTSTSLPLKSKGNPGLSERELAVLRAMSHGERNKEIAQRLSITEHTVKAHLTSIYNKLNVDLRASAVMRAMELGILSVSKADF